MWIGTGPAPPHDLEVVRAHLARVFGARVAVEGWTDRPADAYDERRRQHSSSRILAWLAGRAPQGGTKMLGLTDVDLFIPVLTFVFGEAQLGGRVAVVSAARLREPGVGPRASALRLARLAKEAVHEVGHTFGLVHCDVPRCVMSRSFGLGEVDEKNDRLCRDCLIRLEDAASLSEVSP